MARPGSLAPRRLPSVIGGAGGCEVHLLILIWFPYRRWLLLVILNLSSTIAVGAVLSVIYPTTAITTWANLHCRHLHVEHPRSGNRGPVL
jgi:hypothetical protein